MSEMVEKVAEAIRNAVRSEEPDVVLGWHLAEVAARTAIEAIRLEPSGPFDHKAHDFNKIIDAALKEPA